MLPHSIWLTHLLWNHQPFHNLIKNAGTFVPEPPAECILQLVEQATELLPLYYKHNNMASFVRQLHIYGFHKVVSVDSGAKLDKDHMEFSHPYFLRGHRDLFRLMKRKIPTSQKEKAKQSISKVGDFSLVNLCLHSSSMVKLTPFNIFLKKIWSELQMVKENGCPCGCPFVFNEAREWCSTRSTTTKAKRSI